MRIDILVKDMPRVDVLIIDIFSSNIFLMVFAFLITNVETITAGIKIITYTYFCFSIYKNHNAEVGMPIANVQITNISKVGILAIDISIAKAFYLIYL